MCVLVSVRGECGVCAGVSVRGECGVCAGVSVRDECVVQCECVGCTSIPLSSSARVRPMFSMLFP